MDTLAGPLIAAVCLLLGVALLLVAVTNVMRPLWATEERRHETLLLAVGGFGLLALGLWLLS